MRDSNGKLAGWDLPRDHFVIEEILEVKYPQSYQATFGGTPETMRMIGEGVEFIYYNYASKNFERVKISPAHTHMVIPTEKGPPIPPQRSNHTPLQKSAQQPILRMPVQTAPQQQPTLGMPIQTTPLQQSTTMQVVLTLANTVAHTRSSPQQSINQGAAGVTPRFLFNPNSQSTLLTVVKSRSTWVLTSKTSPTNPNDPIDQANTLV
jgi:hypothetical protein